MKVKGTSFLARKRMISENFGEAAWDNFLARLARDEPFFAAPIMATTLCPVEPYVKMQELMVETFYNNNPRAYWDIGEASAQWALTTGPYKGYLGSPDIETFVKSFPTIWSTYYTEGNLSTTFSNKMVNAKLNTPFWHIAFELSTMGYFHRALELFTQRKVATKVVTGGSATRQIHYQFYI